MSRKKKVELWSLFLENIGKYLGQKSKVEWFQDSDKDETKAARSLCVPDCKILLRVREERKWKKNEERRKWL